MGADTFVSSRKKRSEGELSKTPHYRQARWEQTGVAFFLALLVASSYAGAQKETAQAVSVPLSRVEMTREETAAYQQADIKARLKDERERTMAMLDSVISHEAAKEETKQNALAQKTEIAASMESEARTSAALEAMGYEGAQVFCGGTDVFVFVPWEAAAREADRVRIVDATASQTGFAADCIKIILAKK